MTTFIEVEVPLLCHLPLAEPRISEIISDFGDYAVIWGYYPKFARVIEREFPLAQPFLGKICCILTLPAMVKCPQRVTWLLSPMLCIGGKDRLHGLALCPWATLLLLCCASE